MIAKRFTKDRVRNAIFGCLFAMIGIFGGAAGIMMQPVYAVPEETATAEGGDAEGAAAESTTEAVTSESTTQGGVSCKKSLLHIGWIVCSLVEDVSNAVDFLYGWIEPILVVNPIEMGEGKPIYEVWNYIKGVTNIAFVIFLLVMIYSQITGYGITNYGLKKALPKLIVAAVMVNLSFVICSLAVEVSNIFGSSLRGLLEGIQAEAFASVSIEGASITWANILMASGAAGAVATLVLAPGVIWMIIPAVLGGLVSVIVGLFTVAMRQAVIVLLIMVAPMAIAANMFPNTEQWFKKWKDLLVRMLVFYPMFSLLFGASSLAGWALIASAVELQNGMMLIVGMAVRVLPLFFAVNMMKMSGTFLSTVHSKLSGLAARPLAANRAWAESHRDLMNAKKLEHGRTPSAHLMMFLSNRRIMRDAETSKLNDSIKARGAAKYALSNYKWNGHISKRGERMYEIQARTAEYERAVRMNEDNFNEGLRDLNNNEDYRKTIANMKKDMRRGKGAYSTRIKGWTLDERLRFLDAKNVNAFDDLKVETARGAEIEYQNARGFLGRILNAKFAYDDNEAKLAGNKLHQMHPGALDDPNNLARYGRWKAIMEGQNDGVQFALEDAASSAHAQLQIKQSKAQAAAQLTPATQNVVDHLHDLMKNRDRNIDAIIGRLRVLNMRGDTDLVGEKLVEFLSGDNGIELGTYASQAIANYAMFDVKDNDPVLRRFGKYINMQTAAVYNDKEPEKRRKKKNVSWWEYVNSEYVECDDDGNVMYDDDGNLVMVKTRGMGELLLGTTYSKVERTAFKAQMEMVRAGSYKLKPDGTISSEFDLEQYLDRLNGLWGAIMPNVVGDQFSYLSGSEQVRALARALTGIGSDGKFDWKFFLGNDLKEPTLEQKVKILSQVRDRVKQFLGGHTASQIARSKTDVLKSVQSLYALLDEVTYENSDGKEVIDPERLKKFEERKFVDGDKKTPGSYESFLSEKEDAITDRFRHSFKDSSLVGFLKQTKKGYQGESKDLLFTMLKPEEIYGQYLGNDTNRQRSHDEDGPIERNDESEDDEFGDSRTFDNDSVKITDERSNYFGSKGEDVEGFWNAVRDSVWNVVAKHPTSGHLLYEFNELDHGGYRRHGGVGGLYAYIMQVFFGGIR